MKNVLYITILAACLICSSCGKDKCEGTNTVAFTFKDGTTGKGISNKEFDVNLITFRGDGGIKERKNVGHVKTNDSGFFKLEYICEKPKLGND